MEQFLPVLLCILLVGSVAVQGEDTYCTGHQHEPSLYLRVCCVTSNLGQTVHMNENNNVKIIVCPSVRLQSCPPGKSQVSRTMQ